LGSAGQWLRVEPAKELDMRNHLRYGIAALALWSGTFVSAQDTASISGTVRDPAGAIVANAQVAVTNTERGVNRTTTTNSDGEYSVGALPVPAAYNVTVTAAGFKKYEAKGVVLSVAQHGGAS
jgi:Carboxypeptidase regulatory-like domain